MAVSIPREAHSAFKTLGTEIACSPNDYRAAAHPYGIYREPCVSTLQPIAGFGHVAWDFSVYGRDPYYEALFSLNAGRGFPSPAFLPRPFKSIYADEEKPNQSYIGLIGQAIMSSPDKKMVLSDIYKWVLTHYAYFRNKGPGWKNSVRHNLSLNDCFIKAGRSPNGKGNYWAINPDNYDDFRKGDFRRRRAQRRVRKSNQDTTTEKAQTFGDEGVLDTQDLPRNKYGANLVEEELENGHSGIAPLTRENVKVRTFDVENLLRIEKPKNETFECQTARTMSSIAETF